MSVCGQNFTLTQNIDPRFLSLLRTSYTKDFLSAPLCTDVFSEFDVQLKGL